jgi:hypothetical protein
VRSRRVHAKVWVAWGRWWAVQVQMQPTISLGIRFELRPLLDIYLGPLTIALGRHPLITNESARHADSCRGFFFSPEEVL